MPKLTSKEREQAINLALQNNFTITEYSFSKDIAEIWVWTPEDYVLRGQKSHAVKAKDWDEAIKLIKRKLVRCPTARCPVCTGRSYSNHRIDFMKQRREELGL